MREINLSKGYVTQVDDSEFERLNQFKWCADEDKRKDGSIRNVYAIRTVRLPNGKRLTQSMHRFILGVTDPGIKVDHHPDFSGLNNQCSNLRVATNAQNSRNQRMPSNNTSGFKGVSWHKKAKKWRADIKGDEKKKHLGYFDSAEQAACAYDLAALELHKEFACTNAILTAA